MSLANLPLLPADRIVLTKEYLEQKYLHEGLNAATIALATQYSKSYVQARIRQAGIPRRRQYKDLLGQKFGKLTVIGLDRVDQVGQAFWECECECGNKKVTRSCLLTGPNAIKSCGCLWKKGYGEIPANHFNNIKNHAGPRGHDFSVTIEEIWELFLKQERKCALSGTLLVFNSPRKGETTASLDRIDSSRGYISGNIQWIHKDINTMKSDLPEDRFIEWAKRIAEYNK